MDRGSSPAKFGVPGRLTITGNPGAGHVGTRSTTRWCGVFETSTGGSACFFARRAWRPGPSSRRGTSSVIGRSRAVSRPRNHGNAAALPGSESASSRRMRQESAARPRIPRWLGLPFGATPVGTQRLDRSGESFSSGRSSSPTAACSARVGHGRDRSEVGLAVGLCLSPC